MKFLFALLFFFGPAVNATEDVATCKNPWVIKLDCMPNECDEFTMSYACQLIRKEDPGAWRRFNCGKWVRTPPVVECGGLDCQEK